MARTIVAAAVQMDAEAAPTPGRLERAGRLVADAAGSGAQLVVLPELFNTGYDYSPDNYSRAESADGQTLAWMRETAARLGVHLAGSLMLLDQRDVYNALLLVAPDGQTWRYDKQYPWGWERAYFRNGDGGPVAHTALGRIGMLVCWDVAHPQLWRHYAGQVDLMVIASCPPDSLSMTFNFPKGDSLTLSQIGSLLESLQGTSDLVFGNMINQQVGWLNVPAVHTVGCGKLTLQVPNGQATTLTLGLSAPHLLSYLPQASQMQISCGLAEGCRIIDANGMPLSVRRQEQGEGSVLGEIALADGMPQPRGAQPLSSLPGVAYAVSDEILPRLSIPVYRSGLRQARGPAMAPRDREGTLRMALIGTALVAGGVGLLRRRRRVAAGS